MQDFFDVVGSNTQNRFETFNQLLNDYIVSVHSQDALKEDRNVILYALEYYNVTRQKIKDFWYSISNTSRKKLLETDPEDPSKNEIFGLFLHEAAYIDE